MSGTFISQKLPQQAFATSHLPEASHMITLAAREPGRLSNFKGPLSPRRNWRSLGKEEWESGYNKTPGVGVPQKYFGK